MSPSLRSARAFALTGPRPSRHTFKSAVFRDGDRLPERGRAVISRIGQSLFVTSVALRRGPSPQGRRSRRGSCQKTRTCVRRAFARAAHKKGKSQHADDLAAGPEGPEEPEAEGGHARAAHDVEFARPPLRAASEGRAPEAWRLHD